MRNSENDLLYVKYDDTIYTLTLPEGNKSISTLSSELSTQLDTLELGVNVAYSTSTNKITLTNGAVKEFEILATSTAGAVIGIGTSDVTFPMSTATTLPNVYDLNDINQVEIRSNLIFNEAYSSKDSGYADILQRVPVKYVGGLITWENRSNRIFPLRGGLSKVYMAMYTIDGDALSNNGLDWTVHFSRIKKYRRRIYNYGNSKLATETIRQAWKSLYAKNKASAELRKEGLQRSEGHSKRVLGRGGEDRPQRSGQGRGLRPEAHRQGKQDYRTLARSEIHSDRGSYLAGAKHDQLGARSGEGGEQKPKGTPPSIGGSAGPSKV